MTAQPSRRGRGRPPHPDILTPREWQVLDLLREGLTNEQIAQRLDISLAGAKYHVAEIISKLGVQTREEAAAWQPEAVAVRWWQRATAWVPRRAWPLAGAAGALTALAALAWFVFGASAGEDDNTVASQSSGSPDASQSAAASPTPQDLTFPPLSIPNVEDTKLLFIRGRSDYRDPGALWMSDLDGSNAQVLIDEPAVTDVIRVTRHWQTGNPTVYYELNQQGPSPSPPYLPPARHTIFTLDFVTGHRAEVLSFEITGGQTGAAADVTDGGQYIAYTDLEGLAIFDANTGQARRILSPSPPEGCHAELCNTHYLRPSWSPDGSLIAFNQVFWEGGHVLLVDPNGDPPQLTRVEYDGIYQFKWAPSGNVLCAVDHGQYDRKVGLVISRAPDWQPQAFLTNYTPKPVPDRLYGEPVHMSGCIWLDDHTVAVHQEGAYLPDQRVKEILVLDLETSRLRNFEEHKEEVSNRLISPVAGRKLLISQFLPAREYRDPIGDNTSPEIVDPETNARHPILTTEDWVVASIPAELLAP